MYEVEVIVPFQDMEHDKQLRKVGEIYWIDNPKRLKTLLGDNSRKTKFVKILKTKKREEYKHKGPKIIMVQPYVYKIGGIETFLHNFAKQYRDRNITLVCNDGDVDQLIGLSQYIDIIVEPQKVLECDILILVNYNADYILDKIIAKKVYQMIHADWEGLTQLPVWEKFVWKKNGQIDEIICVSETAATGLKNSMGYDSKIIYNLLDEDYKEEDGLTFITLSRATKEKGIYRIIEMANKFKEKNKHFIWFLCCATEQISDRKILDALKAIPEIILIEPSIYNKMLIKGCDYLVQLSDTESFCYSAYEALQRNVPVILTDFPEAYNIVDEGENGYIIKRDLSNLDVDKIFNHIPKADYYIDRCNLDDWELVFKGEF